MRRTISQCCCWTAVAGLLSVVGCTTGESAGRATRATPETKDAPEEAPAPESPTPAPTMPLACASDLDCVVCPSPERCGCRVAAADTQCETPTVKCLVAPCANRSASCTGGRCVIRPARAEPCSSDDDCEVRDDDCRCEVFAASVNAPVSDSCEANSCGTRPSKAQFAARCDPQHHRCVLERADAIAEPLRDFTLRLTCEMHGTAISRHTTEVKTSGPWVETRTNDEKPQRTNLEAEDLHPLGSVLASAGFSTFVAETPEPGQPHPGMTYCTLVVKSPTVEVDGKRWMSDDSFFGAAAHAKQALMREVAKLATSRSRSDGAEK